MEHIVLVDPRGSTWRVRVASTRRERARGLLGSEALAADEAMLFPRARWMHTVGMRRAIVVASLDRSLRVVGVARIAPGRLVVPPRTARHALEASEDADLRRGDALAILRTLPPGRGRLGSGIARAPIV